MATIHVGRYRAAAPPVGRVRRQPVRPVGTALVAVLLVLVAAPPVRANPRGAVTPATGAGTGAPAPTGTGESSTAPGRPPDAGATPGPAAGAAPGSTADTIAGKTIRVQHLGERAKGARQRVRDATRNVHNARTNLRIARRNARLAGHATGRQAGRAYEREAQFPPRLAPLARYRRQLARLAPGTSGTDDYRLRQVGHAGSQAYRQLGSARNAYHNATHRLRVDRARYRSLKRQYHRALADLTALRKRHARAVAAADTARRNAATRYASAISSDVRGLGANPKAVRAVRYALAQLGKPYVWGAEGPNAYDCSGLVFAAYRSVGVGLPRVADDQYRATSRRTVPVSQLLPGDLVFYGSEPGNSYSIYHVAMYIGGGRIVQAPDYGIPVQTVPLGLGGVYATTRVLAATGRATTSGPIAAPVTAPGKPSAKPTHHKGTRSASPSTPPTHTTHPSTPPSHSRPPTSKPSRHPSPAPPTTRPSSPPAPPASHSPSPTCPAPTHLLDVLTTILCALR